MLRISSILKKGSTGEEVAELQSALKRLGFLQGSADGIFGQGTETAVKKFQSENGLSADGVVGPRSVTVLSDLLSSGQEAGETNSAPEPAHGSKSLLVRCLELTSMIETSTAAPECYSRVSGNFDKQAVSFGALQWNFGRKTLQPIFLEVYRENKNAMASIFGTENSFFYNLLIGPHEELMNYFVNIQKQTDKSLWQRWKNRFYKVGQLAECVCAQENSARTYYNKALKYCAEYGLTSERAVALLFDICVQNGSIDGTVKAKILARFKSTRSEEDKLVAIAECRAEAALPEYVDDVKSRKVSIARGRGTIHGKVFDLEREFQITLSPAADLSESGRAVA